MKRDTRRTGVFTRRALLLMGGQVALLGGLAARLYQVQVVEGAPLCHAGRGKPHQRADDRAAARDASSTGSAPSSPATSSTGALC